jgi:hypothetical protein
MDAGLIQKLRSYVLEGFHILPKRGAEMGGILLGRVLSESPLSIEITGFEPVPCEYRYGPSYILSDADRIKLELVLANSPALPLPGDSQSARSPVVVGCFRSCTGRELALDAADQQLMRKYFPDPRHLILSIRPVSIFECEAWFFSRINGVLPRVPSQPPEPFGQAMGKVDRSAERPTRPAPTAAPAAEPEAAPLFQETAAVTAPVEQEPAVAAQAEIPAAVPAERTLAAMAGAGPTATASAPPPEVPAVDTNTSQTPRAVRPMPEDLPGGDEAWRLVERRRMMREQRSENGSQRVEDPPAVPAPAEPLVEPRWLLDDHAAEPHKHRLWQLIAALLVLLVSGGAAYQWWDTQQRARWSRLGLDAKPGTGGMEITWDRESPALKEASRGELEVVDSGRTRSVELDAPTLNSGHYTFPSPSGDVLFRLQLYSTGLASAVESVRVVSPGTKTDGKELAANPAAPPPPPPSGAAPAAAAALKPVADQNGAAAPKSAPSVGAPNAEAPVQTAGLPAGAASTPAAPPAIPATPVYEIQPTVPEGVRARIRTPITVPVQVSVDAQGRVSASAAKGDGDGVYRFLAERAAVAAQSWKFRPARSAGGAAVPSTQLVYFTFRN